MPSRWAQLRSLFFLSDEEMGKKDDDHQATAATMLRNPHWQPTAKVPSRRRLRRWITLLLASVAVWFLFSYLTFDFGFDPITGSSSASLEESRTHRNSQGISTPPQQKSNGPLRFHKLAESLNTISATRGGSPRNRNVLFFASSLKSASTLLPMACDMSLELNNYAHFAFISRETITMEDLQRINGIDSSCQIIFHDARPNEAAISTDARLQHATARALYHINTYMHPQAIVMDGTEREEHWFREGARRQSEFMGAPLIELPENAAKRFAWLAKLDSASLTAWDKVDIDIVIQAPSKGSGSLLRLLKSLNAVDFSASTIPHLTIELPHDIEPETQNFLQQFRWPPSRVVPRHVGTQMLSLRHRIPRQRVTEEESAIKFIESFWPLAPKSSHVLVLSPQAEVTPQFFQYVKFAMLEYRYSKTATLQRWDQRLLGLSLTVPQTYMNGSSEFVEPEPLDPTHPKGSRTPFLWQAPHSDAILFMGDKWMELHGLVSQTLERQHDESLPAMLADKSVGKQYPAWMEHMLRLARARGYFTLYPSSDTASTVVTMHKDLFQPPEEYELDLREEPRDGVVFEADNETPTSPLVNILDTLPNDRHLLPFGDIPILDWTGALTDLKTLDAGAREYLLNWRRNVGQCTEEEVLKEWLDPLAKDLFCKRSTEKTSL